MRQADQQIGTRSYDHPDNLFVAQFIGSPAMTSSTAR
jgi:ABC-type sugar transport system ATPase subunit